MPAAPPGFRAPAGALWFLRTADGQSFGPISKSEMDGWVGEGLVTADALVMQQGESQWRYARDVYPVLNQGNLAQATNNVVVYVNNSSPDDGYRKTTRKRQHRGALILTLALLGWFAFGLLCIPAWLMGLEDLKQMRAGRMDRSGEGMTYFGMILGAIGTLLMGLGLILAILFIMALAAGA